MGTVWAAPGLLAVGAPIGDAATYPFAVLGSALGWALLAVIAARRAGRFGDEFYPHWSVEGPNPDAFYELQHWMKDEAEKAGRDASDIGITLTGTTKREPAELCMKLGAGRCVILPPGGDLDGRLPIRLERFAREVIEPLS